MTAERLKQPSDGDWLMVRRTYDGWGYSPLDQINTKNVTRLQPVWTLSTGMNNGHEAAPIVNGGVMFVSTSFNQVLALDAKSGTSAVAVSEPVAEQRARQTGQPRRRAVRRQSVLCRLGEAMLVALDAKTARKSGGRSSATTRIGEYMTAPPLIADGKLLVGISGGDGPNRGFVAAYDPGHRPRDLEDLHDSGAGEPGSETWRGDDWKTGGGATWVTGNYDPETNLVYWGVGNGFPWVGLRGLATTSTPHRRLRSMSRPAPSRGISNTRRTNRGTGMRCRRRFLWTIAAADARSKD